MAQKQVIYTTSSRLACSSCLPSNVIICVSSSLVAPHLCPEGDYEQTYEYRHIEGRVIAACKGVSCGFNTSYIYTLDYNEDALLDGHDLLPREILGVFCKGCLTNWVEDLVGNEIEIDVGDYEVTIVSQHGCETTFSIGGATIPSGIPAEDCALDLGSEDFRWKDLYLCNDAIIEGDITVGGEIIMTSSVIRTNTLDGADDHVISINGGGDELNIDRSAFAAVYGNEHPSWAGTAVLQTGNVSGVALRLVSATGDDSGIIGMYLGSSGSLRWYYDSTGKLIQDPVDGSDIVLTKGGTSVQQPTVTGITAAGIDSASATALTGVVNDVTTVPASTGVRLWAAGTGSIINVINSGADTLTVYPDTGGTINGGAVDAGISVDSGNTGKFLKTAALTWSADIPVASGSITVSDTNSVDLTLSLGVLSADVKVSADAGNDISIHADGIYSSASNITVSDTATVDLTLVADALSADVKISSDAGNDLTAHADGLYLDVGAAAAAWALLGNAGTVDGTNFLGTTDNVALSLRVNNVRALRLQPGAASDKIDIIGGASANSIAGSASELNVICGGGGAGAAANTIAAGATNGNQNCFIGGGSGNLITSVTTSAVGSSILGGTTNTISTSDVSVIGGGISNSISGGNSYAAVIAGGDTNSMTDGYRAVIGGGIANVITSAEYAVIGGGNTNIVNNADYSTVLGGRENEVVDAIYGAVLGGWNNTLTSSANQSDSSVIVGGKNNVLDTADFTVIGGGSTNSITGGNSYSSVIAGGISNTTTNGSRTVIAGGELNTITSSFYSAILGGVQNELTSADFSTILGGYLLKLGASSVGFQRIPSGTTLRDLSGFTGIAYFGDVDLFLGNTANSASKLRLYEPNSSVSYSGANYTSFQAQAQSADIKYTLPATIGAVGTVLRTSASSTPDATLEWTAISGTTDVVTVSSGLVVDLDDDFMAGWVPITDSWSYNSSTSVTVPSGAASRYQVGMKVHFVQSAADKYFYIVGVTDTLLTLTGGNVHTVDNVAISGIQVSCAASVPNFPYGFAYTPTLTGFSANPTFGASFSIVGRLCWMNFTCTVAGTSNATGFTVSLPVNSLGGPSWSGGNAGSDNSAARGDIQAQISAAASVATLFTQGGLANWTASGTKSANFSIVYPI